MKVSCMYGTHGLFEHFKGFRPEWHILTVYRCRDIPFWLETFDLFPLRIMLNIQGKAFASRTLRLDVICLLRFVVH